uniref:Uncharacterized protein n=1 Tax=Rhizophora mucronata TaxID=61149 RepID=A0A2P2QPZ4_RHIMU
MFWAILPLSPFSITHPTDVLQLSKMEFPFLICHLIGVNLPRTHLVTHG